MKLAPILNLSFSAKMKEMYSSLQSEMQEYIMNSDKKSLDEIQNITRKYSPDTSFDDFKHVSKNVSPYCKGYIKTPLKIYSNNGDIYKIEAVPETVYVRYPKIEEKNSNVILLGRILHECTHVLQRHTEDRISEIDLYTKLIEKNSKLENFVTNTNASDRYIFNKIDDELISILNAYCKNNGDIPNVIDKKLNIDDVFKKVTSLNAKTTAKIVIRKYMYFAKDNFGNIDNDFILDDIKAKALREKEAYSNQIKSTKKLMKIRNKTDFDLIVELYSTIAQAANDIKKESINKLA